MSEIDPKAWTRALGEQFAQAFPAAQAPLVDRLTQIGLRPGVEVFRFRVRWREPEGNGQSDLVLRVYPDPGGVPRYERAVAALRLANEVEAPAPALWFSDDRARPPYLAHEWVEGEPFSVAWRRKRADATPERLAGALAALHQRSAGRAPRAASATPAARLERLRRELGGEGQADLLAAVERLARQSPGSGPVTLCHGDFRPEHVRLVPRRGPVLVEWDEAGPGDPRLDLGRASVVLAMDYSGALRTPFLSAYRSERSVAPEELSWFEGLGAVELAVRESDPTRQAFLRNWLHERH